MSKRTAEEIMHSFIDKDASMIENQSKIEMAADVHAIMHLMTATNNSFDDTAMRIANKVLEFLRVIEKEEAGCLAITMQSIRMGVCCWINDTMFDASEKSMFEHYKN
jgi:hypothetical protein